jgi:hypothetical protein
MADNIQNLISGADNNLDKILKTSLRHSAESNISLPVYTKEVKEIKPFSRDPFYAGFVEKNKPGIVNINPLSIKNEKETLGHEAEHLQQIEAEKFINQAIKITI